MTLLQILLQIDSWKYHASESFLWFCDIAAARKAQCTMKRYFHRWWPGARARATTRAATTRLRQHFLGQNQNFRQRLHPQSRICCVEHGIRICRMHFGRNTRTPSLSPNNDSANSQWPEGKEALQLQWAFPLSWRRQDEWLSPFNSKKGALTLSLDFSQVFDACLWMRDAEKVRCKRASQSILAYLYSEILCLQQYSCWSAGQRVGLTEFNIWQSHTSLHFSVDDISQLVHLSFEIDWPLESGQQTSGSTLLAVKRTNEVEYNVIPMYHKRTFSWKSVCHTFWPEESGSTILV